MAKVVAMGRSRSAWSLNESFYDGIRARRPQYKLMDKFLVPPFSGRAFKVQKGRTFRIVQQEGPQVGEVALWNADDPKEYYGPMRQRMWEGAAFRPNTRLWSEVPGLRPMATCLEDTVETQPSDGDFHHHRFWNFCTPETIEMVVGHAVSNACSLNLTRAIEPFGLTENNLLDSIIVFQKARLGPSDGRWHIAPSDAEQGDYIEFFAEIDLLVAISACPSSGNTKYDEGSILPLGVEIYETGIKPRTSTPFTDWRPNWKGKWIPPQN